MEGEESGLVPTMTEEKLLPGESRSERSAAEVREDARHLQEKVSQLSESLNEIEKNLQEAEGKTDR